MDGRKLVLWRKRFRDKISARAAGTTSMGLYLYYWAVLYLPLKDVNVIGDRVKVALEEQR